MPKLGLALLVASSFLGYSVALATELAGQATRPLTLRIYDHAKIHPHILHRAQKQTSRIFRQVGIEIDWFDCSPSSQRLPSNHACHADLGPADLVVRILPESMSKKYGLAREVFGYTLPTNKGRLGRTANLFYGRVFDMAYYGPVGGGFETAQAVILGHVMAHEIGHILLGVGSHSENGIMSFPWGRKQLIAASRSRLRFTPQQSKKILIRLDDLFAHGVQTTGEPTDTERPLPRLTVRLYDYGEAPAKTVQQAKEIAAGIFKKIAVDLTWLDCFPPHRHQTPDRSCREPPTSTAINFRLVRRSKNAEVFECGLAIPINEGQFSKQAIVAYECVESLAVTAGSTRVAVLGHIISHEIGHLLLGVGSHSPDGIMRYPWGRREVELADKGWLGFTAQQAERIRLQIRARMQAEGPKTMVERGETSESTSKR